MKLELLKKQLSPKRYQHSLRVAELASCYAPRIGVDPQKAYLAGLLHDCAHELAPEVLLQKCLEFGIVIGNIERKNPFLLHGPVGSQLAKRDYGIEDPAVLAAIAEHTTGKPGMGKLSRIVCLADYVEPGRTFSGVEKIRALAEENLDLALLRALENTIAYLLAEERLIHPLTILTRNWLLEEVRP
ncbi:MAG TPA: bis(5'-nucleosyl)-tetraphosphatase (symmetrical) YqeK [Bacillota bacterium]|jgi:predicted HD superfamily hydrolase involved in NAD metabolism|nr:bis(5'-nucleosyl)-tetraphosphatase (symmetrical) YqeK [Bacillota bacterium]